ncbi:MAG: hypothetical protein KKE91_05090 [Candidatus Omnitrophica bacterium]|nr:hypothetical protein [Candidatus Omnitrophota bacterium]
MLLILVRLLALAILVIGVWFLINPKMMNNYAAFWKKDKRLRIGGVINLIFGIIFLMAASQCKVAIVIIIMGFIALVKGIMLFVLGPEKAKAMIAKWENKPAGTVRAFAVIPILIGSLLMWAI